MGTAALAKTKSTIDEGVKVTTRSVHYATEPPKTGSVLYLAGPTYMEAGDVHWHEAAMAYLRQCEFRGVVCLPTPIDGNWRVKEETDQMDWQFRNLARATVIIFWVPRAGLVTFAEFGEWYRSGKVVLGIPPNTEKTDYLRYCASKASVPMADSLDRTLDLALALCGDVAST